ncbi:hypothetical protein K440DRAFT_409294 [Wilcoxina mikolae CBS 423.85]|nr:hypothetical protein K440DRAFT_409294 [Wilcoxina mikolae CBS 423.85]
MLTRTTTTSTGLDPNINRRIHTFVAARSHIGGGPENVDHHRIAPHPRRAIILGRYCAKLLAGLAAWLPVNNYYLDGTWCRKSPSIHEEEARLVLFRRACRLYHISAYQHDFFSRGFPKHWGKFFG